MKLLMPQVIKGDPLEFIDKGIRDARQLGGLKAIDTIINLRAARQIQELWLEQQQTKSCPNQKSK